MLRQRMIPWPRQDTIRPDADRRHQTIDYSGIEGVDVRRLVTPALKLASFGPGIRVANEETVGSQFLSLPRITRRFSSSSALSLRASETSIRYLAGRSKACFERADPDPQCHLIEACSSPVQAIFLRVILLKFWAGRSVILLSKSLKNRIYFDGSPRTALIFSA